MRVAERLCRDVGLHEVGRDMLQHYVLSFDLFAKVIFLQIDKLLLSRCRFVLSNLDGRHTIHKYER